MSALEEMRSRVGALLDEVERDCATAMEQAVTRATADLAAERRALIEQGRQVERERTLLLIAMQLERWNAKGSNSAALHALRRAVRGESIDD